jgi:hypothetical protein
LAPTDAGKRLTYCLSLASDMADQRGYGVSDSSSVNLEEHPSLEFFHLSLEDLDQLSKGFDEMLDTVLGVFGGIA